MAALGSSTIGLRLESLEDLCASACSCYMVKITKTGSDKKHSRNTRKSRLYFILKPLGSCNFFLIIKVREIKIPKNK